MTAAIAGLAALGIVLFLSGIPPLRRARLAARVDPYLSGLHGRPSSLLIGSVAGTQGLRRWLRALVTRFISTDQTGLRARLSSTGSRPDPTDFRLEQVIWALTATLMSWGLFAIAGIGGLSIEPLAVPALTAVAFAGGFLARDWWLTKQIAARLSVVEQELPTAIDLVTLAIMAGESVPAAFARVAEALSSEVGREFASVVADIRGGSTATDALDDMRTRLPVAGIARFCDALITGIERGTPLAEVLRAQADDGREARRRWLLALGGRREVLMLIPVVFLIMPVVVGFTLLPGLVALDLLVP